MFGVSFGVIFHQEWLLEWVSTILFNPKHLRVFFFSWLNLLHWFSIFTVCTHQVVVFTRLPKHWHLENINNEQWYPKALISNMGHIYMITTIMNDRSYPSFPVRKGLPPKKNPWIMERWITDYASARTFPITPLSFIIHGPCSLGVTEVSIKLPQPLTTVCLPCKQDCLFAFSLLAQLPIPHR